MAQKRTRKNQQTRKLEYDNLPIELTNEEVNNRTRSIYEIQFQNWKDTRTDLSEKEHNEELSDESNPEGEEVDEMLSEMGSNN